MVVIDDDDVVKVHIHTNNPGFVIEEALILLLHLHFTKRVAEEKRLASQARLKAQFHFISYLNSRELLYTEKIYASGRLNSLAFAYLFIFFLSRAN